MEIHMSQEEYTENLDLNLNTTTNAFLNIPIARQHSFYLSGPILSPEHYSKWFHVIRNASENDVVILHINSPGGDVATAIQFMRVIAETPATVVASAEGNCMSAAAMIFLAADSHQISEHSCFMFHNYSGISVGKGGEMYDNIIFERKWSERMLRSIYADFLTDDEIEAMLNNRDVWMDGEEVAKRLEKRYEKLAKEMEDEENGC
jgi:ATP-dependent protease ClpP protease subunit